VSQYDRGFESNNNNNLSLQTELYPLAAYSSPRRQLSTITPNFSPNFFTSSNSPVSITGNSGANINNNTISPSTVKQQRKISTSQTAANFPIHNRPNVTKSNSFKILPQMERRSSLSGGMPPRIISGDYQPQQLQQTQTKVKGTLAYLQFMFNILPAFANMSFLDWLKVLFLAFVLLTFLQRKLTAV